MACFQREEWQGRGNFMVRILGSFRKPLILIHHRADRMKTTITENQSNWSHGPQPCLTQWNYEPCCVGPPKTDRSWWRVLTKHVPLEKGMANHFSILALRTPRTVWKGKKIDTERWTPQVGRYPICYWRRVEQKLQKEWRDGAKVKTTHSCGCDWWWK